MKKFLSLVLALVMTMSLVTVAGAKDFTDAADIQYEEAVAVLSEVGVVDGYADGNFNPDVELNRGQAAKIICNLVLGPTTAAALKANVAPFTDVPADHHFAGYIAYCVEQGFVSGYADGSFKPGNKLTGYAFQKMLLCALGYDQEIEGYTGENWSIQVAKQALAIGLTNNLKEAFNGVDYVTREEACLYALNALQATTVEYDAKIIANVGGAQVTVGTSVATDVKWNIAKNTDGNIKDDNYVQFAEKHFPKLELQEGNGIYGRPANTWKTNKKEIGTFCSIAPVLVYTEATKEKEVYKDLGKDVVEEYTWVAYVNGDEAEVYEPVKGVDDEWEYTGEGSVCEIYVNDDAETVTVVEYNWYLGQVSKVKSDDDGEYISVDVLSEGAKNILDVKTFYVEGYAEDDLVVFTIDYDEEDKDYVIGEVADPEVITAEVSRVDKDTKEANKADTGRTYLKTSEGKYVYAEDADEEKDNAQTWQDHIVYDLDGTKNEKVHPELNKEYNIYLDPNGYVIAFEIAEETVDQYLFVKDSDEEMKDWKAKVELTDGTTATIGVDDELSKTDKGEVKVPYNGQTYTFEGKDDVVAWTPANAKDQTNIEGLIWKYSVGSDELYDLTYIKVSADSIAKTETQYAMNAKDNNGEFTGKIKNGKAYVIDDTTSFIVDKKTVFVDTVNNTTYVGYDEVPNVDKAELVYVLDGKIAEVVFILSGEIYDEGSVYFMLADTTRESLKYDGDHYWAYSKAYVDGEKTTLNIAYDAASSDKDVLKAADTLYQVKKTVDEEYIVEVVEKAVNKYNVETVGVDAFWLDVVDGKIDKSEKFDTDEETVFVVVEKNVKDEYKIYEGDLSDMDFDEDYDIVVAVVEDDGEQYAELVYIYKTEKKVDDEGNTAPNDVIADVSDPAKVVVNPTDTELADALKAIEAAIKAEKFTVIEKTINEKGDYVFTAEKVVSGFTQTVNFVYAPAVVEE